MGPGSEQNRTKCDIPQSEDTEAPETLNWGFFSYSDRGPLSPQSHTASELDPGTSTCLHTQPKIEEPSTSLSTKLKIDIIEEEIYTTNRLDVSVPATTMEYDDQARPVMHYWIKVLVGRGYVCTNQLDGISQNRGGAIEWVVKRRYREFLGLDKSLSKILPKMASISLPLPRRSLLNADASEVRKRQSNLEAYLKMVVIIKRARVSQPLRSFLELDGHGSPLDI